MNQGQTILPPELRSRLQAQLGHDFADFEASLADTAPTTIRLNPRKQSDFFLTDQQVPWCEEGRYLSSRPNFTLDPLFHAGTYYAQEASSMVISYLIKQHLDLQRDLKVLDLSAAPGGKATLLHSLINSTSLLVANELISKRNSILQHNLARWGAANVVVTQNEARRFAKIPEFFDLILVDAPCSGEGLLRRDPAAALEWSEGNVKACAARQQRILADIIPSLAPGGILIYSTCTYSELENEINADWFLKESGFHNLEVDFPEDWNIQSQPGGAPGYRFYPHQVAGEGFFVAMFQRSGTAVPEPGRRIDRRLERPTPADSRWLEKAQDYAYLQTDKLRYAFPAPLATHYFDLKSQLRIRSAGLFLGKTYPNGLQPSPELALFPGLSSGVQRLELDGSTALDYLAHQPIALPADLTAGRHLITHHDFGLGWINKLKNGQYRNNYPTAWRILNRKA